MTHVGDWIAGGLDVFGWAVVFWLTHPVVMLLSAIPVLGRAWWAFRGRAAENRLAAWGVEVSVELSRVVLFAGILYLAGVDGSRIGTYLGYAGTEWPLLIGESVTLLLLFALVNLVLGIATGNLNVVGRSFRVGPLRNLPEERRLLVVFTTKNLVVIPLFMICLVGLLHSAG